MAREVWTGRRFTDEELHEISGIEQIEDIDHLSRVLDTLLASQPATSVLWLCFDALAPERSFDIERVFANQHSQPASPGSDQEQLSPGLRAAQGQGAGRN